MVVVASRLNVLRCIGDYVNSTLGSGSAWMLDGSVDMAKRKAAIDRFNGTSAGPHVCLLVVNLAVGINLVGANHLIILAPSYNPALDAQSSPASGRRVLSRPRTRSAIRALR